MDWDGIMSPPPRPALSTSRYASPPVHPPTPNQTRQRLGLGGGGGSWRRPALLRSAGGGDGLLLLQLGPEHVGAAAAQHDGVHPLHLVPVLVLRRTEGQRGPPQNAPKTRHKKKTPKTGKKQSNHNLLLQKSQQFLSKSTKQHKKKHICVPPQDGWAAISFIGKRTQSSSRARESAFYTATHLQLWKNNEQKKNETGFWFRRLLSRQALQRIAFTGWTEAAKPAGTIQCGNSKIDPQHLSNVSLLLAVVNPSKQGNEQN